MNRLLVVLLLAFVATGSWLLLRGGGSDQAERRTVRAQTGEVLRVAVATGRVEPRDEVPVKSLSGGTVHDLFVPLGKKVLAGERLAEVRPVITEQQLIAAERAVDAAKQGEESAREFLDGQHLVAGALRLLQGNRNIERMHASAVLGREQAEERLRLLREGKVDVGGRAIDFVVRAPVDGHVIRRHVRVGDPVVPSSNFGSGTVLVTLADMDRMVFRGTVDEIDVGRLREGNDARITLGALPGVVLNGKLAEIALQAGSRDGAVVFDVRIDVERPPDLVLRAGYSAVAEIQVARAADAVVVPERVVVFRDDKTFVEVQRGDGQVAEVEVSLGLSDGLTVEVRTGLSDGDVVLEPRENRR